jgi:uncharacterized protein YbjT (DUF2867 family)
MVKLTGVVFGSTGLIGSHLVEELLTDEAYDRVVMVTRKPVERNHPKLVIQTIDLMDAEAIESVIPEGAVVFSAIGTTMKTVKWDRDLYRSIDFGINEAIANASVRKNVTALLVVSSIGANSQSSNFYTALKGQIEESLREKNLRSLIIVQPSLLVGSRSGFRLGEKLAQWIMPRFSFLMPSAYRPIKGIEVARAMVRYSKKQLTGVQVITYQEMKTHQIK